MTAVCHTAARNREVTTCIGLQLSSAMRADGKSWLRLWHDVRARQPFVCNYFWAHVCIHVRQNIPLSAHKVGGCCDAMPSSLTEQLLILTDAIDNLLIKFGRPSSCFCNGRLDVERHAPSFTARWRAKRPHLLRGERAKKATQGVRGVPRQHSEAQLILQNSFALCSQANNSIQLHTIDSKDRRLLSGAPACHRYSQ